MAGLAAANRLVAGGLGVTVLEARPRIGGRIWTVHDHAPGVPIELGAEFVHGTAAPVAEVARRAGLGLIEVDGESMTGSGGCLRPAGDSLARLGGIMGRLDAQRDPDRSFADALRAMPGVRRADRRLALRYVEGFEAADPALISERALAPAGKLGHALDDPRESRTARIVGGYDGIVDALADPVRARVRLGRIVTRVRWRAGGVDLQFRTPSGRSVSGLSARAAIVTVPLGVLLAPPGARARIEFDPPLPGLARFAGRLAFGAATRVALALDEPFWSSRRYGARHGGARPALAFLFTDADVPFPTWWTAYPMPEPMLVGWRGGPGSRAFSHRSADAVADAAVRSAAALFGVTRRTVERHVRAAYTHDWNADPYALGAYSYARVGGSGAARALARPVEGTIYLAGEHTYGRGREGTVDAAIASGRRAAELILRAARGSQ